MKKQLITRQRFLIFSVFIVTICLTCLAVIYFTFSTDPNCRDRVIKGVPFYPNATLISTNKELNETRTDFGSIEQVYETTASLDEMVEFYNGRSPCSQFAQPKDNVVCLGGSEDGRLFYNIEMTPKDNGTIFTLSFGWQCEKD